MEKYLLTMRYSDVDETIDSIEKDILAYKEFKKTQEDELD